MALAYEIDSLEGLSENLKSEYEKTDTGKFHLKVSGMPKGDDVSGLKAKISELLNEKKTAEQKARDALTAAEQLRLDTAKKNGDTEALIKSYEDKLVNTKTTHETELVALKSRLQQMTAGEKSAKLAADLARKVKGKDGKEYSTVEVLEHIIRQRIKAEIKDGNVVLVVLDKDGKPSANTIEDLKNEILNNPSYSPLITGSKASGAVDQGAGPVKGVDNDLMKLSPEERLNAARAAQKK
jgi:flagellar biosynthesis/type III secretory pathway protein FliH